MDIVDGYSETEDGVWRWFDPISSQGIEFLDSTHSVKA